MLQVNEANEDAGNLILNRYSRSGSTWSLQSHMTLNGFGHGVAFGIWRDSIGIGWIFTECEAGSNGRGQRINWFKYVGGTTLNFVSPEGPWNPNLGTDYTCVIDASHTYLAIRYKRASDGAWYYQAYAINSFAGGGPIIEVGAPLLGPAGFPECPDDDQVGSSNHFQGWTVSGRWLYTISQTDATNFHGRIRSYDLNHTLNNAAGYRDLRDLGVPSNPAVSEFEGLSCGYNASGQTYKLLYMIRTTGNPDGHEFNLHAIT